MRTKQELEQGCALLIHNLRTKHGYSKFKFASILGINNHTLDKWENGESFPTVPEFIAMFDKLDDSALRAVLDYLYPDRYLNLSSKSSISDIRMATLHYIRHIISDHSLRELNFLFFGDHGSNIAPQLEMFTMVDHLPLEYRIAVAELILTLWNVAKDKNELIFNNQAVPNVELFVDGLNKAKEATHNGNKSYTTSSK